MGKNDKTGLGRALVKKHNHMVQQAKEKGRLQRKKVLESVTEVTDIETVIENAEEAELLFNADHPTPSLPIDLDGGSSADGRTLEEKRRQQQSEEELHASSIRVPRRPSWNASMTPEELDTSEKQAFLIWRRGLAKLEDNERLVLTPFEKNIDIWRQLWRVIERSDLLVTVVDARDPMFYRCPDLEAYVKEVDEHKRTLLLMNKADLLPYNVRVQWAKYFRDHSVLYLFWSAKAATATLDGKNLTMSMETDTIPEESDDTLDVKIYGRDELLARLQFEAEDIASMRKHVGPSNSVSDSSSGVVTVGFVGYPNVGKSSTINALVGQKRTGVTSTPGKTKHFQTLIISEKLTLCDCPGLVFPSFTSSRYEMIACGVLPIDRMTAHRDAVQVVANRVPRRAIEAVYKISLPKPKSYEPQNRSPLASELLRAYCASRGYVGSSGLPDETKAARIMLKDYVDGKLPHFELPPGMSYEDDEENEITSEEESDESDVESSSLVDADASGSIPENVMKDLESFDVVNGLAEDKAKVKKKAPTAPHKQHKKPQRKKDRSWRAANYDGDGMPVVRVFQKPVNTGLAS